MDRQREVIFNDRLPRFDELMRLVEARIRHVGLGEPSAWVRLLWSKPARWSDVSAVPSAPGDGTATSRSSSLRRRTITDPSSRAHVFHSVLLVVSWLTAVSLSILLFATPTRSG
jgi:hypothetical protein